MKTYTLNICVTEITLAKNQCVIKALNDSLKVGDILVWSK